MHRNFIDRWVGVRAGLLRRLRNGAFRSAAANVVLGERYDKRIAFKAWLELLGEL